MSYYNFAELGDLGGVIQHPRNVAAAIKAGAGRTAAPHIRVADVLGCFQIGRASCRERV